MNPPTHRARDILVGHKDYWLLQLIGWFGVWIMAFLDLDASTVSPVLASQATFCVAGLCASHVLRIVILKRDWLTLSPTGLLPRVLAYSFLLSGIACALVLPGLAGRQHTSPDGSTIALYLKNAAILAMILFTWGMIYCGYQYDRGRQEARLRLAELNVALRESALQALRSQIDPHFLFNSLTSVRALIRIDQAKACEAVTHLAVLLRASLRTGRVELITLSEEINTVRTYLALERLRLGDRLSVRESICTASLEALVPSFLLQTLVENAVKHGISQLPNGGQIDIRSSIDSNERRLHLHVSNPGFLRCEATAAAGGSSPTGLENSRQRLALLFDNQAFVNIRESMPGIVSVDVQIPYKVQ